MAHSADYTVIAPPGDVDPVREAGGELLAQGVPLEGGGQAWDVCLSASEADALEAAGATLARRAYPVTMADVLAEHGYTELLHRDE